MKFKVTFKVRGMWDVVHGCSFPEAQRIAKKTCGVIKADRCLRCSTLVDMLDYGLCAICDRALHQTIKLTDF